MHSQSGEHVLNGDRGKVDYTVSAGDVMTDTHSAPNTAPHPADDRHQSKWTAEDVTSQPAASLRLYKLWTQKQKIQGTVIYLIMLQIIFCFKMTTCCNFVTCFHLFLSQFNVSHGGRQNWYKI
ncbi:hypothetical protein XENORESO_015500 [Xenotaenia resolanae]|uniref:Uncharacterized protein n=1 Tax=Xenotaenia resolanae TaxID=208358 RepID=A0ABV0W3S2_9TELE